MLFKMCKQTKVLENRVTWLAVEAFERADLVSDEVLKDIAYKR